MRAGFLKKLPLKRAGLAALLTVLMFLGLFLGLVLAQGVDTFLDIERSGVGTSRFTVNMTGATQSRFIIGGTSLIVYPPTGLLLIYVDGDTVQISWTMGLYAENSMVRGAIGRVPQSRSDGYLVYYGTASNTTDNGVDLEDETVYYRVFSQNSWGVWEDEGIWDSIGGTALMLIAIVVIALGITALAFILKNPILHIVGVPAWLALGALLWNQPWPAANTYLATAFMLLAISVAIVHLVMTVNHYLGQRSTPPSHDEIQSSFKEKVRKLTQQKKEEEFWP